MTLSDLHTIEQKAKDILTLRNLGQSYAKNYHEDVLWLVAEVKRLREAIIDMRNNLGVPQPGYPAPVAVAYDIGTKALDG
jgi:hypothetical protein